MEYEFDLVLQEPWIVWANGPHAPSIHDTTVLCVGDPDKEEKWDQNALYFQFEEGKKCIGECTPQDNGDGSAWNRPIQLWK